MEFELIKSLASIIEKAFLDSNEFGRSLVRTIAEDEIYAQLDLMGSPREIANRIVVTLLRDFRTEGCEVLQRLIAEIGELFHLNTDGPSAHLDQYLSNLPFTPKTSSPSVSTPQTKTTTVNLEIVLDGELEYFSADEFLRELRTLTRSDIKSVHIKGIKKGSIRIILAGAPDEINLVKQALLRSKVICGFEIKEINSKPTNEVSNATEQTSESVRPEDSPLELLRIVRKMVKEMVKGRQSQDIIFDEDDLVNHVLLKYLELQPKTSSWLGDNERPLQEFVRNRVLDVWRRQRYRYSLAPMITHDKSEAPSHPSFEEAVFTRVQKENFLTLIRSRLSPKEKEVFDLRFSQNLSNHEIAEKLQITQQAVANRIMRIRDKAREIFRKIERES